ncbi:MAG: HAD hydrolase-like protein, partial [Firmicutes bacterium]|nr:HAD hydrolase-like protein [Bacillota bacterium]
MKIRAVFFDMFNTLADPHEHLEHIESEILGMTPAQWNSYVWQKDIARDRGLGIIKTEDELIERICDILPFPLSPEQKKAVMAAHRERLLTCMTEIPADVQAAVRAVKDMGLKLGVISNDDVVDISGWPKSPLYPLFDDAVFSCDVGIEKPDKGIYETAL